VARADRVLPRPVLPLRRGQHGAAPAWGAPPIWVAGNAPGGIWRAAQYSSGWLPYCMDLAAFRAGVATLRDLTRGRGGPAIANMFYVRIEKPDEPAAVPSTSPWVEGQFAGSADAVAKHLERYRQAGLAYALCGFESEGLDDLLRLFASSPIGSRRSSPTLNSRTNTPVSISHVGDGSPPADLAPQSGNELGTVDGRFCNTVLLRRRANSEGASLTGDTNLAMKEQR
jgi:hypothetical protein